MMVVARGKRNLRTLAHCNGQLAGGDWLAALLAASLNFFRL